MTTAVEPFGITTAEPAVPGIVPDTSGLALCPTRQITVTDEGEPFVHVPSMKSAFETVSQTREDSQLADDTENDKD